MITHYMFGVDTQILLENMVNSTAVDTMALCIASSSASMALTMQGKLVFILYQYPQCST